MVPTSFHNRDNERNSLAQIIQSHRSELTIVYGRRGVGKTALLEHALNESGQPYIFYRATRRTLPFQMEELTEVTRQAFLDAFLPQPFSNFLEFLQFITHQSNTQDNPVIAVIDELSYLADTDIGLLTVIQHWWDANKRRPNIKLFLAGSYISFMEKQVLDVNAPLYNRRTGQIMLLPMDYAEAALFFPKYAPQEKMTAYSILGGLPSYLEQFDPAQSIEQNVKSTILRQNTYLSEEPDWLLLEDLRKDSVYGSILRSIAHGARRPSDIARAIGKNSAQDITSSLDTLRELRLVAREVPVTDAKDGRSRNSLYWIDDPYIDFWYRFVDPSRSLITRGLGARLWETTIEPNLNQYVSMPTFERASRQYLWRALSSGTLPSEIEFTQIGTWWGRKDREIDIVGLNAQNRVTLLGECKWRRTPMDITDYADMLKDITICGPDIGIDPGDIGTEQGPWLMMFSRSGFTERLEELARKQQPPRLILIGVDDMYALS